MPRPKNPPGTKTRDNKVSFTLFLRPDDHERLKDEAAGAGLSLQDFIQSKAIGRPLPSARAEADPTKPRNVKNAPEPAFEQTASAIQNNEVLAKSMFGKAMPGQLDLEVEALKARIKELEAQSPVEVAQTALRGATDQQVVDAAVAIIRNVAMRNRLMLYLGGGEDKYVPISTVRLVGAISGGDGSIFLGTEERIVEKGDGLAAENAKLLMADQRLREANQGLADENQRIRADSSQRLQKLQDEVTRLTAKTKMALKSAVLATLIDDACAILWELRERGAVWVHPTGSGGWGGWEPQPKHVGEGDVRNLHLVPDVDLDLDEQPGGSS